MAYKKVFIRYMTGTGNSFRVSSWIKEKALSENIPVDIKQIHSQSAPEQNEITDQDLLAVCMPTHGFTSPWAVISYVLRMPRVKRGNAIVLPTCAGSKIGKFIMPGVSGTAGYIISLMLLLKGYSIMGIKSVDMPSNFMQVHPAFSLKTSESIIKRAHNKTNEFLDIVFSGKKCFGFPFQLILGLLLFFISMLYLVIGRFFLAKLFFANNKCTSCGLCAKLCPHKGIKLTGKKKRPYWSYNCESCGRCLSFCPNKSIEVCHPLIFIYIYVTHFSVAKYFFDGLCIKLFVINSNLYYCVITPIFIAFLLLSFWLSYIVFHIIIRVNFLNKIFSLLSFTHYYSLYKEPQTDISSISHDD